MSKCEFSRNIETVVKASFNRRLFDTFCLYRSRSEWRPDEIRNVIVTRYLLASTVLAASTALITASTASAQESGGWDFEGVPSWSIPDSIAAGELTNLTFGVNWYLEDHVRVMANLVDGTLSVPGAADTDVSGAQLRLQWDF